MKKITLLLVVAILPFLGFGQNVAPNPTLDGASSWSDLSPGTSQAYDAAMTRTADGSGSYLINSSGGYNSGIKSSNIAQVNVPAGDYLFSYYVYGTAGDKTKPVVRDNSGGGNINGETYIIVADNTWEKVEQTFTMSGSGTVNLRALVNSDDPAIDFHVDDFSFTYIQPEGNNLTVNIVGAGSVDLTLDKPAYEDTDVETLTAIPATHWDFDSWSGAITGSTNPESITMDADKTVTANFVIEPSFEYAFNFDVDGNLEGWTMDPQVSVASHTGGLVTLSLVADQWSRFNLYNFPIPTATYNKLTVIVKNEEATTNQFGIAVGSGNETLTFPLLSQAEFQTIEVDLTKYEAWTGDVENIRVRFADENNTEKTGRPSASHNVVIESIVFTFDESLSTEDVANVDASINLFPNPAKDVLNISSEAALVEVFNILGQKVVSQNNTSSLNVSGLASGSYIAKIQSASGAIITKKFIKE